MNAPSSNLARPPRGRCVRLATTVALAALLTSACSLLPNRHPALSSRSAASLHRGLPDNEPLPPEAGLHGPPLVR